MQIGRSTLYELLHRGELRVVRLGRAVRISAAEIERFVESNEFEW
ncbi:MAG: helix-turn-helix domain-containing protein [Dehalococcoidia bacterium]